MLRLLIAGSQTSARVGETAFQSEKSEKASDRVVYTWAMGYITLQLTADVPGFTADECEKISRAMHDSQDEDFGVLQEIDDTISSKDQFSEVRSTELRNHSTDLGSLVIAWRTESRAIKSSMS